MDDILDRAMVAVGELGLDPTEDMSEQMEVFRAALEVYADRELTYGSAWKDAMMSEFISDLDKKTRRIQSGLAALQVPSATATTSAQRQKIADSIRDSAIDIANYAAFIARRITDYV